jgi:hypothetical protein
MSTELDPRTAKTIATLDPKAQPLFTKFSLAAQAVAAKHGCIYRGIGGNRTWAEQDALYAKGREAGHPGPIVTWTRRSAHIPDLTGLCAAVDLGISVQKGSAWEYVNGDTAEELKLYQDIDKVMKKLNPDNTLPIKQGVVTKDRRKTDLGHIQLY